ncbi:MAG: PqqD family protein [Eubacteriales bacterium]|nr:PqqD family protein [Eubacteriales bacterium]
MKYIAKSDFELKDIAGDIILLPRGAQTVDYNYVMVFNEAGAEIYKAIESEKTLEQLAQLLVDKYNIDQSTALADAKEYVEKMVENEIVDCIED